MAVLKVKRLPTTLETVVRDPQPARTTRNIGIDDDITPPCLVVLAMQIIEKPLS